MKKCMKAIAKLLPAYPDGLFILPKRRVERSKDGRRFQSGRGLHCSRCGAGDFAAKPIFRKRVRREGKGQKTDFSGEKMVAVAGEMCNVISRC